MELTAEEVRVLGCLVEKQLTTPQQYPLTLNALTLACNQTSNRDPVVTYPEAVVEEAVTRAKARGLARFVHPSHGRSALRYRHELQEQLGLGQEQLALLAVLMLRGPQTVGELRARTERMARFADLAEVEAELRALTARDEPLVRRLPRAPGRKEERFVHAFAPADLASPDGDSDGGPHGPAATGAAMPASSTASAPPVRPAGDDALRRELEELRGEMEQLRGEMEQLRGELEELRHSLGD
ncbi:MAG TPA: DUF480 domain-containing protein [Acidimicrobiales bacterium]|nr:DUF480 domain-containing protein [Acidimicrobiales bacterium]